jgi:3-deoxy-D-manno-octulosonic-acid transferase
MELEVWYNFMVQADRFNIPVIVANGRMTESSKRAYRLIGALTSRMFRRISYVFAQDEEIAGRFRAVGVPAERISVAGTMKYDSTVVAQEVPGSGELARALGIKATHHLWVAGCTGPGEEEEILTAHQQLLQEGHANIRLAIVPRHPERFAEVASLIRVRGFALRRRSKHPDLPLEQTAEGPRVMGFGLLDPVGALPRDTVVLGDTMGELDKFYSLARVVFVGRSLVPLGGSDMMEPAGLGKAIIFGPHTFNFAEPVRALLEAEAAFQIAGPAELSPVLQRLLGDPGLARTVGQRAQKVILDRKGATEKHMKLICRILGRSAHHHARTCAPPVDKAALRQNQATVR